MGSLYPPPEDIAVITDGIEIPCADNIYGKGCGKILKIIDLIYIKSFEWKMKENSLVGYWIEKPGEFVCPLCKHVNIEDKSICEISELKYLFKDIIDNRIRNEKRKEQRQSEQRFF